MAVRAVGPFAPGLPRMAAPMGLQEACRPQAAGPRRVAFWPGARGVLNCDLVPQGPAVLQIFFRIGPVQEFSSDMAQVSSLLALMALIGFAVVEVATRVFT
jgi:hypothetical protein